MDEYVISNKQLKLRPNPKKCNSKFLFYYFSLPQMVQHINDIAIGSAVPGINLGLLKGIKVCLPPKNQQDKIAAILSAYDDLIENNKRRIALLEKMAGEIYREWFVRFRFPGYQTAEFEKGIPKGWGMVKLEKAFQFLGGGTPSKENEAYWKDGNINWFTPSDITGASGIFLSGSGDQPNEEGLNNCSAKLFPAYSIMMNSRATIVEIGINRTEACTNQGLITCIPNKQHPLHYLYFWLKLSRNYFISLCGGATFPEINKSTFKRIEILTPSESIVKKFSCVAGPVFEQIETLLQENENLNKTKNLLLPRLISGKLSLENLDIQFPPSMQELG
ncbi:restriction endonuclease subunit S [Teredinibacter turnerae]|uniref:restriction endonuclease subunit S n=1 Tax=Teredinibacter turnerae TaxID=2426 RepID=UPI000362C8E9|nr:restriction endonuclease subunit S [Teredinibacter turnerae]